MPSEFSPVTLLREPGMAEEITYYDEELTELIQNIEDGVDTLAKKRYPAKTEVTAQRLMWREPAC